ncbi:hypothetical protein D910_02991 [Dendroctonus ponderosae]|uniref:Odorant receptor n=1 Tax=Dendroctonus ponderosae TaxID=77166 RepID=U4TXN7_DENPD|nr:hypothetical protein D910_02991 [Dendroctonus ponderosae]
MYKLTCAFKHLESTLTVSLWIAPVFSIHFYYNCIFTFNVLFEIGICCWFATLMTNKGNDVADACYNYNWLHSSSATRKLLLIMLCRSQKPLFITVGKIIQLSIGSFLSNDDDSRNSDDISLLRKNNDATANFDFFS